MFDAIRPVIRHAVAIIVLAAAAMGAIGCGSMRSAKSMRAAPCALLGIERTTPPEYKPIPQGTYSYDESSDAGDAGSNAAESPATVTILAPMVITPESAAVAPAKAEGMPSDDEETPERDDPESPEAPRVPEPEE